MTDTDKIATPMFQTSFVTRITALALALLAVGCSPGPKQPAPPSPHRPNAEPAMPASETEETTRARIEANLGAIRVRHNCNRLMGCPPATALVQDMPASVAPILLVLRNADRADGYWLEMLIDILGQSDRPEVVRPLEGLSRDRRWAVKIRAVLALGRVAAHTDQNTRDLMSEAELMAAKSGDLAWLGAVLLTRSRLDPKENVSARSRLLSLYPTNHDDVVAISAPILDWLVLIATDARLTGAATALRSACLSDNRFVSVNAMKAVGRFQDTGAVPHLMARIEDRQPGVRRAALEALQDITGNRRATSVAEWREWAVLHKLDSLPSDIRVATPPEPESPSGN